MKKVLIYTTAFIYLSLTKGVIETSSNYGYMILTLVGLAGLIGMISAMYLILKSSKPTKLKGKVTFSLILIGMCAVIYIGLDVEGMSAIMITIILPIFASARVSIRYYQLMNSES